MLKIQWKAFFLRLLVLLPVIATVAGRAQDDEGHIHAADTIWKNIQATIQLIREDRVEALAARVVYPLKRENPLPDITTRKKFGQAYRMLFDSTLKRALSRLRPADFFHNEENWSFEGGDIWFDPGGKIIAINYSSPEERRRRDSLTAATYRLLYPGIAHWDRNVLVCKAGKRLIRVDQVGDDLRYISWEEGKTISDKPDLVLFKGVEEADGTEGGYTITFSNGPWAYAFVYIVDGDPGTPLGLYLHISKNDKEIVRYKCREIK